MSIAKKFVKELRLIPMDEKGFYNCRLAEGWIARVRHQSLRVSFPMGEDSYDATERHEFADGSVIVVGNPEQIAFSLNVYEEE
jgi:hypothetical protein